MKPASLRDAIARDIEKARGSFAPREGQVVDALETFPNPHPGRDYTIVHTCPEFTAVCPKTGQPDFGTIRITYVPDRECVELKSLKSTSRATATGGSTTRHVTNVILDDLVAALRPRRMTVEGDFHVRGGISTVVRAEYEAPPRGAAASAAVMAAHASSPAASWPGETADSAIAAGRALHARGINATFDLLGEDVLDREAAVRSAEANKDLLRRIPPEVERNVSIKLTMMGLDIAEDFCLELAVRRARHRARGRRLRAHRHGGLEAHPAHARRLPRAARDLRQRRHRAPGLPAPHASTT